MALDPSKVKTHSEKAIRKIGGKICDWLPIIERPKPRTKAQLIGRSLVLNAIINIYFGAPIPVIKGWIEEHDLEAHLTRKERALLKKSAAKLSQRERAQLLWNNEALWALMWAGGLNAKLDPTKHGSEKMASMVPNLQRNEGGAKFSRKMRLRSHDELFRMCDLHFRLHWWTRDGQLNRYSTEPVSNDVIMERRKALEWLLDDESDWDNMTLNT